MDGYFTQYWTLQRLISDQSTSTTKVVCLYL